MDSGSDDWCYVDMEANDSLRSPSFDMAEPEIEVEPMYVEEPIISRKPAQVAVNREIDVTELLRDTATQTSIPSRAFRLSLLSPAHQRYVVTGTTPQPQPIARKRSVREAFTTPSRRAHAESSYVGRLRAAMPSRRRKVSAVEGTPVQPFTRDQGVQADIEDTGVPSDRVADLSSVLDRSLRLSMELKCKSHDVARRDVRDMLQHQRVGDLEEVNSKLMKQLRTAERGLRISRKRSELAEEYQDHLKRCIEHLRAENDTLLERMEVLSGGLDVETKSIAELEHLEDTLDKVMIKIRSALRTKYRAAMRGPVTRSPSEDACVVCMEKLACVRLEPCGHHVLCSECAMRVTECPVDRQRIDDKVLTHGLNAYTSTE